MALKNLLAKNGFAIVRDKFITEVIELRTKMEDVFKRYSNSNEDIEPLMFKLFKEDFEGFHGCAITCQNLLDIVKLSCSDKMITILKSLGIQIPVVNTHPLVSFSAPGLSNHEVYWKVPAHQDWPSMQGSINAVTCWMPLFNVTDELGPLEFATTTHILGPLPHEDVKVPIIDRSYGYDFQFEPVKLKIGDAVFFTPFTVHRSGINQTTDKVRWSMHFRYDDAAEKTFIERKYPRHRTDKRKEGILHPGFPSYNLVQEYYDRLYREKEN